MSCAGHCLFGQQGRAHVKGPGVVSGMLSCADLAYGPDLHSLEVAPWAASPALGALTATALSLQCCPAT